MNSHPSKLTSDQPWPNTLSSALTSKCFHAAGTLFSLLQNGAPAESEDPTLMGDIANLALLNAYHPQGLHEESNRLAEVCAEKLANAVLDPALFHGFTGVGWLLEHLDHPLSAAQPTAIDLALESFLSTPRRYIEFDLLSGLVGIGVYGLERAHRGLGDKIVSMAIESLVNQSTRTKFGTFWQRPGPQTRRLDLGVAHGTSGVVAFLSLASAAGFETADQLLLESVEWLLREGIGAPSDLLVAIPPTGFGSDPPAWCRGELGLSRSLFLAGKSLQSSAYLKFASALALSSLERANAADAGLCHGYLGFALIAKRFYVDTNDRRFLVFVEQFVDKALTEQSPRYGTYQYRFIRGQAGTHEPAFTNKDLSVLGGVSGVALGLIACSSEREPEWDRLLLLS